jgi:DNA-binding LacI/PurR family transcriptional regulator
LSSIKDVAREASVSISTVSLAYNDPMRVAENTRKRIFAAARKLGYVAKVSRGREGTQKPAIVLTSGEFSSFQQAVLQGIQEGLTDCGISMIFMTISQKDTSAYGILMDMIKSAQICGIILFTTFSYTSAFEDVAHLYDIPVVRCLGAEIDEHSGSVVVDNYDAGVQVARYCMRKKYDSIMILGPQFSGGELRVRGFLDTIKAEHSKINYERMQVAINEDCINGYVKMTEIIESGDALPNAIFCLMDSLAIGVIGAIKEHGIRIPEDISVIGCDDISAARYIQPELTTICIPRREQGYQASLLLNRMIGGGLLEHIVVKSKLIERASSKRKAD